MKPLKRLEALERQIRGWLPKDSILSSPHKMPRPWWWRPFWGSCIALMVALAIIQYSYRVAPMGTILEGVVLASVLLGASYYIRIRPRLTVNRAIWILFGITPIGFFIFAILFASGTGGYIGDTLGSTPDTLGGWLILVPFIIGAFIGNWIGKRRNYRLPMSP
jgi:hypothetical protein